MQEFQDTEVKCLNKKFLKAYEEKKSKKPATIAKSNIIFDVKPWDDSIEIADIEKNIRTIELDGLVWGAAKVLPVAYGIKKLQVWNLLYNVCKWASNKTATIGLK